MGSRDAVWSAIAEHCRNDTDLLVDVAGVYDDMLDGRYTVGTGDASCDLRDLVLQTRNLPDLRSAGLVALQLHHWAHTGAGAWATVDVGGAPYPDEETDRNRAQLHRGVPDNIGVTLWGGSAAFDGVVDYPREQVPYPLRWERCQLPLEVGTTTPEVLVRHILCFGGFVRWPFNRTHLYLFRLRPDVWAQLHAAPTPAA